MADTPESKPPFWSSLPGIFTGIGGVLVALTGLITALVQTGVIPSKANSNAVLPVNTAVTLASAPAASPSAIVENSRYKSFEGEWAVTENPSLNFKGVKEVKWIYNATVSDDVITLQGRVSPENKGLPNDAEELTSTVKVKLVDSKGMGGYRSNKTMGDYDLSLKLFDGDPPRLEGSIQQGAEVKCLLKGKKK